MSIFWKPGDEPPGGSTISLPSDSLTRIRFNETAQVSYVHNRHARNPLSEQRRLLPIFNHRSAILHTVKTHRVVVIVGETGSGKTTQIPQYLHEAGWTSTGKIIGCTQPRRISCIGVAKRVCEEVGQHSVGDGLVGYDIQFDHCFSQETRLKYLTDGMLIREMMMDPLLSAYSVLMIDEAHERSLHTDIVIGLLKKILRRREDLRVIVSSATLEAESFTTFFSEFPCWILSIEGRQFPVDVCYLSRPCPDYVREVVETVMMIHATKPDGDILAFVTGQSEVNEVLDLLGQRKPESDRMMLLPLYSGLPIEQQIRVFEEASFGMRKVVISTNVAEASVTIDGIAYVVDSGFVKQRYFSPARNKDVLAVSMVSQASAKQRAGRAGRVRKGIAFRLYTEEAFAAMPRHTVPEIQRCNLGTVVLQLKALAIDDVLHFDFLSPPPSANLAKALETLFLLQAIDGRSALTEPLGLRMAEFPVEPRLAKLLLQSGEMGCSEEMLTVASFLTVQHVFSLVRRDALKVEKAQQKFAVMEGDPVAFLNIYDAFLRVPQKKKWCQDHLIEFRCMKRALKVRHQLREYLCRFGIPIVSCNGDIEIVQKCFCTGFFEHVAQRRPEGYFVPIRGDQDERFFIHPSSTLFKYPPEWVVYYELVETTKKFMRDVMKIDPNWLVEICPLLFKFQRLGGSLKSTAPGTAAPQRPS